MKLSIAAATSLLALTCLTALAQPTSTNSISLQAKLDGVAGPIVSLKVQFWDDPDNTDPIHKIGTAILLTDRPITNGIVSIPVYPIDPAIFNGQTRYMGISVNGGTELSPRTLVTSVPYAIMASSLAGSGTTDLTARSLSLDGGPGAVSNLLVQSRFEGHTSGTSAGAIFRFWGIAGAQGDEGLAINWYRPLDGKLQALRVFDSTDMLSEVFSVTTDGLTDTRILNLDARLDSNGVGRVPNLVVNSRYNGVGTNQAGAVFRVFGAFGHDGDEGLAINYVQGVGETDAIRVFDSADLASSPFRVNTAGHCWTRVLHITGADVAEPFNLSKSDTLPEPQPGMVVSIDPANPGKLMVCSAVYDKKVAGAISGAGGLSVGVVMGKDNPDPLIKGDHPVAMSGRVYVWCDATSGAIKPGDRLTTSNTPGHAMKVIDESRAGGAVIGKAMTELKDGKGLVLVLVNLQ